MINFTYFTFSPQKQRQSTNQERINYLRRRQTVNGVTAFFQRERESPSIRASFRELERLEVVVPPKGPECCQVVLEVGGRGPHGFQHHSGSVSWFREERPNGRKCTTSSPPPRAAIMEHPWSLMERTSHLKSSHSVSVIIHGHHFLRI